MFIKPRQAIAVEDAVVVAVVVTEEDHVAVAMSRDIRSAETSNPTTETY